MSGYMVDKINSIQWRQPKRVDISSFSKSQSSIRKKCMDATLNMLRQMSRIADRSTYPDVARGMLLIANTTPIKCMCVGISPYENGILPPFATALAYSPRNCVGATPSVQVMSQIMSLCAIEIKDRYANKNGSVGEFVYPSRDEYTKKFAMMLRCSYSCSEAGVAFVNSCPVITDSISKTCLAHSLFSEWLANMIIIHNESGYKLWIVSMGASADKVIDSATGSYPNLSSSMRLIRTMNPAGLARMNVSKNEIESPIDDRIQPAERLIDSIVGVSPYPNVKAGFFWTRYEDATLKRFVGVDPIKPLVARLVDHAPDRLLNLCATSIQKLYAIMSDYELESAMADFGVSQEATQNASTEHYTNEASNEPHQATVNDNSSAQQNVMINPFEQGYSDANANKNADPNANSNTNTNNNGETSSGPYRYPMRSQLGQLLDPTGKGVSQQTIVIDSITTSCERLLTANKQTAFDMIELAQRQARLMDMLTKNLGSNEQIFEEAKEYMLECKDFIDNTVTDMSESAGIIKAMYAVIEGDKGIYAHETMPVAGLLRRDDGSIKKQFIYGNTMTAGQSKPSSTQFESQPTQPVRTATQTPSVNPTAINPFDLAGDTNPGSSANAYSNLIETGDKTYDSIADQHLKRMIKTIYNGCEIPPKAVYDNLNSFAVKLGNTSTNMYEILKTIVSQRITLNSGSNIDEDEMEALINCLDSGSNEDLNNVEDIFADAISDQSKLVEFFEQLMMSEDTTEDETDDE